MNRRVLQSFVLFVLMFSFLVACPSGQTKPEGILYQAESLYISQRTDYMSFFSYDAETQKYTVKASVTEEQKAVLRMREKVLKEFKLAIDVYRGFVKSGEVPSVEAEQRLVSFIRQFSSGGG